jgi:hypothetical protein
MAAGALAVGHRAIAEFVNVKAVFAWLQAGEFANDFDTVIFLGESDFAFHFVIAKSVHYGDSVRYLAAHPGVVSSCPGSFLRALSFALLRFCDLEFHGHCNNC